MNAEDHEAQRETLAAAVLKRMTSSYIGAPPPALRGDAERAVWAVIHEGWQPPVTDALIKHMARRWRDRLVSAGATPEFVPWEFYIREMEWILREAAKGVPPEGEE